jgi:predicted transposase YbfD/YdcC
MERLLSILREVRDPRDMNARHDCCAMLFVSLMATLCGAKTCVDIADFCDANFEDISEIVDLSHGPPSHDSFSRLFRLLDPQELSRALASFAAAFREGLNLGPVSGVVAIDGKRMRGAYERGRSHMPALMVSVWDAQTRLSLAAQASADGNEVAATLKVLKSLDLKGCVVTADALHCHPAMAEAVLARKGDYALKLKGNNGPLLACAEKAFETADREGRLVCAQTLEKGHDRTERRRLSLTPAPKDAPALPGLKLFGRLESERSPFGRQGKPRTHYIAVSKTMPPEKLLAIIRDHWGVENQVHWPLDVVFTEDGARTRKDNGPFNLSIIRRMALDILKAHPDKRSVARKMKMATWKKDYFLCLFAYLR